MFNNKFNAHFCVTSKIGINLQAEQGNLPQNSSDAWEHGNPTEIKVWWSVEYQFTKVQLFHQRGILVD